MPEETPLNESDPLRAAGERREEASTSRKRKLGKRVGWALVIILGPILALAAFLSSPIGKRVITDQIAQLSPASGLRFSVGRIEGDIYSRAVLRDVALSDPQGVFLTIPEAEIDWRPLNWLWSGLDIRKLAARRGTLERLPELKAGDPDAPILPGFDIRVDSFILEDFTLGAGVTTADAQPVNAEARVDISEGRAFVEAKAAFGLEDRIALLLDAEPDGDLFDLALDYEAAADGPLAALAGLDAAYSARIAGEGTWSSWLGYAIVQRAKLQAEAADRQGLAAFELTNKAGRFGLLGQITPPAGLEGIASEALGDALSLAFSGTLEDGVVDGRLGAVSDAFASSARGAVDLTGNAFDQLELRARLRDPDLFARTLRLEGARLQAALDGSFRDLAIDHKLGVARADLAGIIVEGLSHESTARYNGERWRLPLDVAVDRIVTGNALIDPALVSGSLTGAIGLKDDILSSENAKIAFSTLGAAPEFRGSLQGGSYALAGPLRAQDLQLDGLGTINGEADLLVQFGARQPYSLRADIDARVHKIANKALAGFIGEELSLDGQLAMGGGQPIVLRSATANSPALTAQFETRIAEGKTVFEGSGAHEEYGRFALDGSLTGEGPRARLTLANPLPAAGLEDVRIALSPRESGFGFDIGGRSLLGPFDGALALFLPGEAPPRLEIERLKVSQTTARGTLIFAEAGPKGELELRGGGLSGTAALSPAQAGASRFSADLVADDVRFEGDTLIALQYADIEASGEFGGGAPLQLDAQVEGRGLRYGAVQVDNLAASAELAGGEGRVTGAIAGSRADRFELKFNADFEPERIAAIARGRFGGSAITMPRRAILTKRSGGGWQLAPTQIGFARGFAILEGGFGGEAGIQASASLAKMPLRLVDLAGADLGLGGRLSGRVEFAQSPAAAPSAKARIEIADFSRSGLVLSSRPVNVIAGIDLEADQLVAAAKLADGDEALGRVDARIANIAPRDGGEAGFFARLRRGALSAELAYQGPAEALWRLAAIETFDLTGPVSAEARATGTLADPAIKGALSSEDLRLQSAISGTDITGLEAEGSFSGSRLELTRFAGKTQGGGSVAGSGSVDLANLGAGRGPSLDIRLAAKDARLLNAAGLDATLTGPLRIVSSGSGGTIAGRVRIGKASWKLGYAAEEMGLPQISTREINEQEETGENLRNRASAAESEDEGANGKWRYLVNASTPSRIAVDGLGLDSEWGADIELRGSVDDPRLGGEARLVRGAYSFAGTRFELTRGRIRFDASVPIDPRLDIEAQTSTGDFEVTIAITGNAAAPEINFSSQPQLPEEEILARLLFGGSVTSLSATDAVQLGAALAALRGGDGGLDPIGQLRRSIGLDQLRIVSADPAIGRSTGVALGKNIGRNIYVEIITDGRGYSATQLEYQITSWLALLGTVTTIGRDNVSVEVSRDY